MQEGKNMGNEVKMSNKVSKKCTEVRGRGRRAVWLVGEQLALAGAQFEGFQANTS
jgi:hypothetical protein